MPYIWSRTSSTRHSGDTVASGWVTALGGVQICLAVIEKMTDGIPIPFVKGSASVALEAIKIMKVICDNRRECEELMERSVSLVIVLGTSFQGLTKQDVPVHMKQAIQRLTDDFEEVIDDLKVIQQKTRKWGHGWMIHGDVAHDLKTCSSKLNWAMQVFQVMQNIDTCVQSLRRGEESLRSSEALLNGQAEIMDKLRNLGHRMPQTSTATCSLPSSEMLPEPVIFGREEFIEAAIKVMYSNVGALLAILGPPGMGKTAAALKIIHDSRVVQLFGGNRYWVPCDRATSLELFVELLARSLNLTPCASNDLLKDVINFIRSSKGRHVFLLDNLETPWNAGPQSDIEDVLVRLRAIPNVSILVTMRGDDYPASACLEWSKPRLPSLTQLTLPASRALFLRISPKDANDPELDKLLMALDCVPLALTLMALLSLEGESPSELLERWESERTKLLDTPGGDRRNSIEDSIKLSLETRSMAQNPSALDLLSVLVMLPAGTFKKFIPKVCPSVTDWRFCLRCLRHAGLVYMSEDQQTVNILSPIRSYVILHHPPKDHLRHDLHEAYFQLAKNSNYRVNREDFLRALPDLRREDINLQAVLLDALKDECAEKEMVVKASLEYTEYLIWTNPRSDVIVGAKRVAHAIGARQYADCLWTHGRLLRLRGQLDSARSNLEEAKAIYATIGYNLGVARCLRSLSVLHRMQDQHLAARAEVIEATKIYKSLGHPFGVINCLVDLGLTFWRQGDFRSAIPLLMKAEVICRAEGDYKSVALCLWCLGNIRREQGLYDIARTLLVEAKSMYVELCFPRGVAQCLRGLAELYRKENRFDSAHTALDEAKKIFAKLHYSLGTARCLYIQGNLYRSEHQLKSAQRSLEEARAKFTALGNRLCGARCLAALGSVYREQRDYDSARKMLSEARRECIRCGDDVEARLCAKELEKLPKQSTPRGPLPIP
ncbi:hypothetical protein FRC02_004295 [Tulasnella sp. 418]|nr:hypothetical protein FRC02_004295 [Tulasnella sp. 418]